ncbi:spore coat protein [Neobacillus mesonae]|nr:spore coat protein [Neobacillus mesonae]
MNPIIEKLMGMGSMTDQVIAMDFLINAKSAVRNYAMAVTESGTPEIKEVLIKHLDEAILTHERIVEYMLDRGWYHPYNKTEQLTLNLQNINTALSLPPN